MKISIIGTGNMGGSIARALAGGTYLKSSDITCTARSAETLSKYQERFNVTTDNQAAVRDADIVIFAVKPWLMEDVVKDVASCMNLDRQIVVSVAAGVSFSQLSEWLGRTDAVMFRVIPNTAIEIGSGVTFISSHNASETQRELIAGMFSEMGYVQEVGEGMMTSGTALASCGIAYAMKYIQAAIAGGEKLGFDQDQARRIVEYTVKGAAELLLSTGNPPQTEIDKVTTPGGLTAKGLAAMDEAGFDQAVVAGLIKATE
jgi:pyrroline-5-carboxylate reductase